VPVLGVAVFTIAQVTGASAGGLAVDRAGLSPGGRLPVSGARLGGAVVGVAAVGLAQAGRPVGDLAVGLAALAVAAGAAVALQAALNGRVSAAAGPGAATLVNFVVSTPALAGLALGTGGLSAWPQEWPSQWYLYVGGPLGVTIVTIMVFTVRAVGVLQTNLAIVAGQLGGALLLDVLIPGGTAPSLAVGCGALLTVGAVALAGRKRRPPATPGEPVGLADSGA
jgi:transporter family-2 protein